MSIDISDTIYLLYFVKKMSEHRYDIRITESCVDPNPLMVERQDPDNSPRLQTRERCALEIAAYVFKSLLRQGLSEPDFYGDLVYKLKRIVGSNNFSAQFIKIISYYKKIGYNINVLQQTACLVVNPITVGNFAFLRWVVLQTL